MTTRPTHPLTTAQREALEARFALRLSARLDQGAQSVSHDISERLRVAREQAMRAARESRTAVAPVAVQMPVAVSVAGLSTAGAGTGGTSTGVVGGWHQNKHARNTGRGKRLDDGPTSWGWRVAAALPIVALVVGLWGIQRYFLHEQVQAATEVDMALLTDDLPPAAYSDPGFAAFLRDDTGPTVRPIENTPPEVNGDLQSTETNPASATP